MKIVDYGNYKSDAQCFYSEYIVIINNNNLPLSIIIMMMCSSPECECHNSAEMGAGVCNCAGRMLFWRNFG